MKESSTKETLRIFEPAPTEKEKRLREIFSPGPPIKEFAATPETDPRFAMFNQDRKNLERYGEPSAPPSIGETILQARQEAQRYQFSPIGRAVVAVIRDGSKKARTIDFGKNGPAVGFSENGALKFQEPVFHLPNLKVVKDGRGNIYSQDHATGLSQVKAPLARSLRPTVVSQCFEDFAVGRWEGQMVIQFLTALMLQPVAERGNALIQIEFTADERGCYPSLLYEMKTGSLTIYGGGQPIIR